MTRIARTLAFAAAAAAATACAPEADPDAVKPAMDAASSERMARGAFPAPDHISVTVEYAGPSSDSEEEPDDGGSDEVEPEPKPEPKPDPAAEQCAQAPDHWMDCPMFDEGAMEEIPGLAELAGACIDWMETRPVDYVAMVEYREDVGGEIEESAEKGTVCGAWVAEARDADTGEPTEPGAFPTVEMVFAEAGRMMMDTGGAVAITYDRDFSYPVRVTARIAADEGMVEKEISYEIERVERVTE